MKITKKDIITYFIVFAFVIVLFMPWITGHYATDTYKIIDIGYKRAAELSLNDRKSFYEYSGVLC